MITPLDIQNKEFKKSVRGYNGAEVDAFLDQIMVDYEQIYKENMELKEQQERDAKQVDKYREMEDTLKQTLVVAQSTAEELQKNAQKKADLIIQEAELGAKDIISNAKHELISIKNQKDEMFQQLQIFKTRYRTLLQSQLESITIDTEDLTSDLRAMGNVSKLSDRILEKS